MFVGVVIRKFTCTELTELTGLEAYLNTSLIISRLTIGLRPLCLSFRDESDFEIFFHKESQNF